MNRIWIAKSLIVLGGLVLIVKLYSVQIIHGDEFKELADRQYVRTEEEVFRRGSIYFEDKNNIRVGAATTGYGFLLALNPRQITDADEIYEKLNSVLPIEKESFFLKAGKANDPHEELAHFLTKQQKDQIEAFDLDGVYLYKESYRNYPGKTLAAHTLGFVGFDGDERTGRYGLERYYEKVLSRKNDGLYINVFAELFSNITETFEGGGYFNAGDIISTIEPNVEAQLEKVLEEVMTVRGAKAVGGIIINPQNGSIYAMSAIPNFDPNKFGEYKDQSLFLNPLVERVYEMGSIIKPLTVAAGLDVGAITPETTYNDKGSLSVDGRTISNYDGKARGVVPMQEVLNQSLNTGVSFIVDQMGTSKFAEYFYKYGLEQKTGIDLPGEVSGLLTTLDSPRKVEYYTASFGQGIALTPIATVRALSSLSNGGRLIRPHVVKAIETESGIVKTITPDVGIQVLKPETSETITKMLVTVVDKALLGGAIKRERYSIAAKTGTAQIVNPQTGRYYDDRFLHSFFGYFPAYNPQFLVFLYVVEPQGVRFASETLTYPFSDLVDYLINYYGVVPDR